MLYISKELFTAWNEANLLYCHWKSNEHLLPGLDGTTDLDVLLSCDDKDIGEEILRKLDFLKCKSQYGSRYPGVEDWIGFDKEKGALIHVHLHYSLVTGHKGMKEYSLPWSDRALETRVFNEDYGVFTMEPNLELVTLYTRIGLKADFKDISRCRKGVFKLSEDTNREVDWLKARADFDKVLLLLERYYGSKAGEMLAIIQQENLDGSSFLRLLNITESVFKGCRRVNYFVRSREKAFFVYQKYLKSIIQKFRIVISKKVPASEKGLSIAFLGQDGAGKTTVTKLLIKWWSWKLDVKYVYLGSGENYFSLKRTLYRKLSPKGPLRHLRSVLALTDTRDLTRKAYKNVKKAEKYVAKGGVVIFDRFPQMNYTGICDGPKIREKVQNTFRNGFMGKLLLPLARSEEKYIKKILSHHPDIVFKLLLPPEESIRRKPQESLEAVTKKHEIVKSLEFDGSDVYTIDATMPFEEEMIMIKNIIWQHIQK